MISRRNLLRGLLATPGLVVVGAGVMESDGRRLYYGHSGVTGTVYLYGRVSYAQPEFHATDAQIARWIDSEAQGLARDFMAAIWRYRQHGWPVQGNDDRRMWVRPDPHFYRL